MTVATQEAPKGAGPYASLVPLRHRRVAGRVLLTNPWGDWAAVTPEDFARLQRDPEALRAELPRAFYRDTVDREALVARAREKHRFLRAGPNLHILVVTLRCNQTCVYCHASRAPMDRQGYDMTPETARRAVDLALASSSPGITLEFQGGEPLAAFDVVREAIEYALQRNATMGKSLGFTLVTNLSLMDDDKLDYLVSRRVQLCTSVDGPAALHDRQRRLHGGSAHAEAAGWIRRINARYAELGLDPDLYRVEALLTTTREALAHPRELVDTYAELGCRAIYLRPVDPFGFAARAGGRVGYPREAFLAFYREALEHILALNRQGVPMIERFAAIFLTKVLTDSDPNFLDLRSPCGAGIGQVAYNHDGGIYTCDEGRMLADAGDPLFRIGHVEGSTYSSLVNHPTVRALTVVSNLDAQPGCVDCAYRPYCGVCPVYNHAAQGDVHGRMPESPWCATHRGILDLLFEKLAEGDPETLALFARWTTVRPRTHYVHG
ncbi:MAG: His-Xaa-Ser system radical SAM maturase HxsB [Deltaproteobacteria bacterium]|nr:His-Xaa-Ser system radical SAM maturase HxsB [Deltaproteobacteria bacterium]